MEVYLDNSATTRTFPEAAGLMQRIMTEEYGNPSSLHRVGLSAEHIVKEAKEIIARTLRVEPGEILFTSGGTESNNMAIIGSALARKRAGNHIITTAIEHPSVLRVMEHLKQEGFSVTIIPPDQTGHIHAEDVLAALTPETILVSCMLVNNEVGTVQPVREIAGGVHRFNPEIRVHTDAVQAYGKIPVLPRELGVDLMSVSAHKLHGPKGVGFLYIKKGTLIRPIIYGGGQQGDLRSGTENVPGIAGMGEAVRLTFADFAGDTEKMKRLKEQLIAGASAMPEVISLSGEAPHIVSLSFAGVRAEVLLHALEDSGIYVSSGSACSSNKKKKGSAVLSAMQLPGELLDTVLRFSLSADNTEEEIRYTVETLEKLVPMLRRYRRG